jgi:hypothetical protein
MENNNLKSLLESLSARVKPELLKEEVFTLSELNEAFTAAGLDTKKYTTEYLAEQMGFIPLNESKRKQAEAWRSITSQIGELRNKVIIPIYNQHMEGLKRKYIESLKNPNAVQVPFETFAKGFEMPAEYKAALAKQAELDKQREQFSDAYDSFTQGKDLSKKISKYGVSGEELVQMGKEAQKKLIDLPAENNKLYYDIKHLGDWKKKELGKSMNTPLPFTQATNRVLDDYDYTNTGLLRLASLPFTLAMDTAATPVQIATNTALGIRDIIKAGRNYWKIIGNNMEIDKQKKLMDKYDGDFGTPSQSFSNPEYSEYNPETREFDFIKNTPFKKGSGVKNLDAIINKPKPEDNYPTDYPSYSAWAVDQVKKKKSKIEDMAANLEGEMPSEAELKRINDLKKSSQEDREAAKEMILRDKENRNPILSQPIQPQVKPRRRATA